MPRPAKKSTATAPRRPRTYNRTRTTRTTRYSVRGRGGYWDNVKKRWGEGGGEMHNTFGDAGHLIGGPAGRQLGGLFNRALYALTGFGDYTIKKNALLETNGPPAVVNNGKEFIVRHREFIQDIYSNSGAANTPSSFAIQSYSINPGQASTFPWLASIASSFEQYTIEGMVFEYKSLYSDAVVTQNGSIGSIVLATEYNAGLPPFVSKQQMENYEFAQSAKPSCSILHPIECAPRQSVLDELYIRPGSLPANEDIKTYDFGDFQIASQGIPLGAAGAAVNLGELWVSYQIAFKKPKLLSSSLYADSGFAAFSTRVGIGPYGTVAMPASYMTKMGSSNMEVTIPADDTLRIQLTSFAQTIQINATWSTNDVVSGGASWRAPGLTLPSSASYQNSNTYAGDYVNNFNPSALRVDAGANTNVFVKLPAKTSSVSYADLVFNSGQFGADQTTGVRLDVYINRVPTILV